MALANDHQQFTGHPHRDTSGTHRFFLFHILLTHQLTDICDQPLWVLWLLQVAARRQAVFQHVKRDAQQGTVGESNTLLELIDVGG